jgi:hypothetical protein
MNGTVDDLVENLKSETGPNKDQILGVNIMNEEAYRSLVQMFPEAAKHSPLLNNDPPYPAAICEVLRRIGLKPQEINTMMAALQSYRMKLKSE